MAISKWLGGIIILIAFIIAGRAQAAESLSVENLYSHASSATSYKISLALSGIS